MGSGAVGVKRDLNPAPRCPLAVHVVSGREVQAKPADLQADEEEVAFTALECRLRRVAVNAFNAIDGALARGFQKCATKRRKRLRAAKRALSSLLRSIAWA